MGLSLFRGPAAALAALALALAGLLPPPAAAGGGRLAGLAELREAAVVDTPGDSYFLAHLYPMVQHGSKLEAVLVFSNGSTGVYRLYALASDHPEARLVGEAVLGGVPVQPLYLGPRRGLVIGNSSNGVLELWLWRPTGALERLGSVELVAGERLLRANLYRSQDRVYILATTVSGTTRLYALYTLSPREWRLLDATVFPVSLTWGQRADVIDWPTGRVVVESSTRARGIVFPTVEASDEGLVVGFYAVAPRPGEESVRILYARFTENGLLKETREHVFRGVNWARMYPESPSAETTAAPSTTLLIALHRNATNRYLVVAGAWGLVGAHEHNLEFRISTGAAAGALGLLAIADQGVIVDTMGATHSIGSIEYSLVLRAARLGGDRVLVAVQDRPAANRYGRVTLYIGETVRANATAAPEPATSSQQGAAQEAPMTPSGGEEASSKPLLIGVAVAALAALVALAAYYRRAT